MQLSGIWRRTKVTARGFSFPLLWVVLVGGMILGTSMDAMMARGQTSKPAAASTGWTPERASSGEITALGTIRQVVSDHVAGSPAGLHILIDGPLGSFDVSLGSYLPSETQQALSAGEPVRITGVVHSANGKDYLFARLLKVAGQDITIRNGNGFLVRNPSPSGSSSDKAVSGRKGGVQ
jgi:hypothetical protein